MKKFYILMLALIAINNANAQGCLPEGITFFTQEQIDSFQINYPGCTEIEGDVTISGSEIINLYGLSVLTSIQGDLIIGAWYPGNPLLSSLVGLGGVTSITGNLVIYCNNILTDLTGLEGLSSIGGGLGIWTNPALIRLTGLEGLTSIGGEIDIWSNHSLTSLTGLDNINSIGGFLEIKMNNSITNLTGLESLTTIGGSLSIGGNESLISLTGLESLTSIGGSLIFGLIGWVSGNSSLTSLTALENLTSIGGDLSIWDNPSLTSLAGLDNIAANSISNLFIHYNSSLATCEAQSICDYLASPGGTVNIFNNAPGCNNPPEVANTCGVALNCLPYGNYYFCNQSEIDNFQVNYPGCTHLEGSALISGGDISNLNGLSGITFIAEDLGIGYLDWGGNGNPALNSLTGLNDLSYIGGDLYVEGNSILNNLVGLDNVTTIGGSLLIANNSSLSTLTGLEGLFSIGEYLGISSNDSLQTITGLNGLNSVGKAVYISGNYTLTSLIGLESLDSIGGSLYIGGLYETGNPLLSSLSGLQGLTVIGGDLSVMNNTSLTSLAGLENIDAGSIANLTVRYNTSLSSCEVQSICEYLSSPGGVIEIRYNAPGCNDPSEIANTCGLDFLCLPYGNYYFNSQSEIDNFQTNYPGCTHLEGYTEISGDDIINLDGLSILNYIGGNLEIRANSNLTSLAGLANVTYIGEDLSIGYYEYWGANPLLTSLAGLEKVTYIGGDLGIFRNYALDDLSGLDNLTFIAGGLGIGYNDSLKSLSGLDKLTHIGKSIEIEGNFSLTSLNGLNELTFIGENLEIGISDEVGNPGLTSLYGLDKLVLIGGDLGIRWNDALENLSGLQSLSALNGDLEIWQNEKLESLSGLNDIDGGSIRNLEIHDNNLLSTCEVESICDYLSNPGGIIKIYNNAYGCESVEAIEAACWVGIENPSVSSSRFAVSSYPNPFSDQTTIKFYLPDSEEITLKLYELTGREVRTLVDGHFEKGEHTFILQDRELQSGIYLIQACARQDMTIQKIILLK